jgi:curved DNA-binding protein CbpA
MDHYRSLGLPRNCTSDEIHQAYRRLARLHHPDRTGEADSSRFRAVREAYEVLSDREARARYDRTLEVDVPVRRETVREVYPMGSRRVREWVRESYPPHRPDPFEDFRRLVWAYFRW